MQRIGKIGCACGTDYTKIFDNKFFYSNLEHSIGVALISTEDLTTYIIQNSKEIMKLLKRDNIKLEEVNDYHIYPIADNDTPKLSADRLEYTFTNGYITKKDLYTLSEQEVITKIENCVDEKISKCFKMFRNSTHINESDDIVLDKYCVSIKAKRRYIVPLVKNNNSYERINKISYLAKEKIDEYLKYETKKYAYLDFNF